MKFESDCGFLNSLIGWKNISRINTPSLMLSFVLSADYMYMISGSLFTTLDNVNYMKKQ